MAGRSSAQRATTPAPRRTIWAFRAAMQQSAIWCAAFLARRVAVALVLSHDDFMV